MLLQHKSLIASHCPTSLFTGISPGQLIVGFSLSVTITSNEHVAVLPDPSVTTNVFVVVPNGKAEPLGNPAVWAIVSPGQLSVDVTVYVTTASHCPTSLFTGISPGQLIVGFSLSVTITSNEHVAVLPDPSVTTNVFVVVPNGKAEPLGNPAV